MLVDGISKRQAMAWEISREQIEYGEEKMLRRSVALNIVESLAAQFGAAPQEDDAQ
jgi:hypothetical protein